MADTGDTVVASAVAVTVAVLATLVAEAVVYVVAVAERQSYPPPAMYCFLQSPPVS